MEINNESQNNYSVELNKENENVNKELPIRWLKFFTYIRIPLGIVMILIQTLSLKNFFVILINLLFCSYGGLVIYGLHKRKFWGWILVLILIVLETILLSLRYLEISLKFFFGYLIIVFFVWCLPNLIYFNKRKHLFN